MSVTVVLPPQLRELAGGVKELPLQVIFVTAVSGG